MNFDTDVIEAFKSLENAKTNDDVIDILNYIKSSSSSVSSSPLWVHAEAFAHIILGDFNLSISLLSRPNSALEILPYTWILLGTAYRRLGGHDRQALYAYFKADHLAPQRADILYNIANTLSDLSDFSSFIFYSRSLCLNPVQPAAWHNLSILLRDFNFTTKSFISLVNSICLDPFNSDAWCNLGIHYIDSAFPYKAKKAFEIALSLDSSHSESNCNLGKLLLDSAEPQLAISHFQKGISTDHKSRLNLGLCQLSLGDLKHGWRSYESRLHNIPSPVSSPRLVSLNQICDVDLDLIIWSEQGIGDSLMFARYLLLLSLLKIRWHFYCPDSLLPLFANCHSFHNNVSSLDLMPISSVNFNIPLLSLPLIFNTSMSTIPSLSPYIRLNNKVQPNLCISPPPGGLSIAIVWASDPSNAKMHNSKSIPLKLLISCLQPFLDLGIAHFHSLQVGCNSTDILCWSHNDNVTDWSQHLTDFNVTAQLVSQMDLVISVDTAVAHLAAAMAIPTWLLLPANSDFRWFQNRNDSPWYPNTMRLFRQTSPGDWNSVVSQLSQCFDDLCLLDLRRITKVF